METVELLQTASVVLDPGYEADTNYWGGGMLNSM